MEVLVDRNWRVRLSFSLEVPRSVGALWKVVSDFPLMACQDLFHRRVVLAGDVPWARLRTRLPAEPCDFRIEHGVGPLVISRHGRILGWKEGYGYAFSDLSMSATGRAFPHVYFLDVTPLGDNRSRVQARVNGRWTTQWVPRAIVRPWLAWCLTRIRTNLRETLERELQIQRGSES